MAINKELLAKIRKLLEDKRSSGVAIELEIMMPKVHLRNVSPQKIEERRQSPVKGQLMTMVDQFLSSLPVTRGCKEFLRDWVSESFNEGVKTDEIMLILEESFQYVDEIGPGRFERRKFLSLAAACAKSPVATSLAPNLVDWGEQILAKYGENEYIRRCIKHFRTMANQESGDG